MKENEEWPSSFRGVTFRSERSDVGMSEIEILGLPNLQEWGTAGYCGCIPESWIPLKCMRRREVQKVLVVKIDVFRIKSRDDRWVKGLFRGGIGHAFMKEGI